MRDQVVTSSSYPAPGCTACCRLRAPSPPAGVVAAEARGGGGGGRRGTGRRRRGTASGDSGSRPAAWSQPRPRTGGGGFRNQASFYQPGGGEPPEGVSFGPRYLLTKPKAPGVCNSTTQPKTQSPLRGGEHPTPCLPMASTGVMAGSGAPLGSSQQAPQGAVFRSEHSPAELRVMVVGCWAEQ